MGFPVAGFVEAAEENYLAFFKTISSVTPLLGTTRKVSSAVLRQTAGKVQTTPQDSPPVGCSGVWSSWWPTRFARPIRVNGGHELLAPEPNGNVFGTI